MKKCIMILLTVIVLLLSMAGCAAARMDRKLDAVEASVEQAVRDTAVTIPEIAVPKAERPVSTATEPTTVTAQPADAAAGSITKEGAEQIALDHVGLTRDQISRLRTEYDIDDGITQYDVEFISGDWEYEFEIHAENGKILSFDKDHKYD